MSSEPDVPRGGRDSLSAAGGFCAPIDPSLLQIGPSLLRPEGYVYVAPVYTRRERLRRWTRNRWYDVRCGVARRVFPEGDYDGEAW